MGLGPRVLWVGCESDAAGAVARAATQPVDIVVVDGSDPALVQDVLQAAARNRCAPRRIATSTYDELPALVRAVEPGVVERVLAKRADLPHVLERFDGSHVELRTGEDDGCTGVHDLLADLVARIVALPAVVIRPLAAGHVPSLQLVVRTSDAWEALRARLPASLGRPLKAAGEATDPRYRRHPLRRLLGKLSRAQEVYALEMDDEPCVAYVALFPWRDAPKVTVVIGVHPADASRVAALHAIAALHAVEFPLPSPHRHSPHLFYDPDYDWVITRSYVGPDRRRTGTSFINRYTFRGRRKALMPNELCSVGTFVDVAPPWAWAAAAVLGALFLVDAVMTANYVGGGRVAELNPLMRWAIERGPIVFWGLKSALCLAVAFIVVRWHLWRPGRWLFGASVLVYAALDAYWLALWCTRWA